jgi:hypothetical protein
VIVEIVLSTMPFNVSFPRFLNQNNIVLWNDLVRRIMHIRINDQADVFVWNLHQNGQYTVKDRGRRPKGGGVVEWEPNQILLQELAYVPSSNPRAKTLQEGDEHTNQQYRNNPLKGANTEEKEWNQLDTRLAKYGQKSE